MQICNVIICKSGGIYTSTVDFLDKQKYYVQLLFFTTSLYLLIKNVKVNLAGYTQDVNVLKQKPLLPLLQKELFDYLKTTSEETDVL